MVSGKEAESFLRKGPLERRQEGCNEGLLEKKDVDGLATSTHLLVSGSCQSAWCSGRLTNLVLIIREAVYLSHMNKFNVKKKYY